MTIKDRLSKKIIYILGGVIILYTLAGFFLLPVIGKNILIDKLSQTLNRTVSIQKMTVNPYSLAATIDALAVKEKNNKTVFLSARKISVNLSLSSLFMVTPVVSEISLENPYIHIVRNEDTTFNFTDFAGSGDKNKESSERYKNTHKKIMDFVLKNIHITDGKILFTDKAARISHVINNFSVSLPFLSSRMKNRYEKSLMDMDFVLNQAKIDLHVESTPFAEDLATQIDLKTGDMDVVHYLSYFSSAFPEDIRLKNLDLNLDLKADYRKKGPRNSLFLKGSLNALNTDIKGAPEKKIINIPLVRVDISKSDILDGQLNISNVFIKTPEVNLNRDKAGRLTLLNYFPQEDKTLENKETDKNSSDNKNSFTFNIADIHIKDASILFQDFSTEKKFISKLFPLNLHIINLEGENSISGEVRLTAETDTKEEIDLKGRFRTNPVQADGTLSLADIILNKYAPYYKEFAGYNIKDGRLDFSASFNLSQHEDRLNAVINHQDILIRALSIFDHKGKEEMLNIPEFKIKGASIDLENKKIDTGAIIARDGKILLKRLKDGRINLVKELSPVQDSKRTASPVSEEHSRQPTGSGTSPWAVTMPAFAGTGFNVQFKDLTNHDPVSINLSDISLKARGLKNFGKEKGSVDVKMNWNKEGRISIKGDYTPSISSAGLDIGVEKIDIKSLQPYFTDAIRILVTDGSIHTKGKLKLGLGDPSKKDLWFVGETSITNFVSLDKQTAKDFFKCNSLYLSGLDISIFPVNINAKDISLTDFYSRIIVSDAGNINLNTIFKKDVTKDQISAPEPKHEKTSSEISQVHVENVTLQGGTISFSDYQTQPNFTASMKQIAGSVTGLSSDEKSRAKFHLQGLHGQSSPLDIVGAVNPLAKKKYADINISFKDIELTDFTPYSSRYLGYKIEKGKLILDLDYKIDGNKLTSENRVRFDNFELGERVESDQATSLPVSLAISLLKNRDGRIDLDLPVTGELDDPQFKMGAIVFKMISNLILKVVTSPFSIIGSMFGGGEELSYIDFDYGQAIIAKADYAKIDKLAQILQKKPSINLEIQGNYDKLRDAESLRVEGFKHLIKAEKLKEMIASGSRVTTLEDVEIKKEEMEHYINIAYARAKFPKPRNESGIEKKLDAAEKKKLLITSIKIGKNDLRLLAMDRSKRIKAYLISTGEVEKQRIFLVEPTENNDADTERTSRVKFLLK